jgi:hypothetical protein
MLHCCQLVCCLLHLLHLRAGPCHHQPPQRHPRQRLPAWSSRCRGEAACPAG